MSLWQDLTSTLNLDAPFKADLIKFEVERLMRKQIVPGLMAYAQDTTQAEGTRHMVLIRLGELFTRSELAYQPTYTLPENFFQIYRQDFINCCAELIKDPDKMVRGNAIAALGKMRAYDKLDSIRQGLQDKQSFVRELTLDVLQQWRVPLQAEKQSPAEELKDMQAHLKDRDGSVRLKATHNMLGLYLDSQYQPAIDEVFSQLKKDRAGYVRYEIAELLGNECARPIAIPALIESIKTDRHAREAALWALIRIGKYHEVPVDIFCESLFDPEWQVVNAAAQGIQLLEFYQAIPHLIEALKKNTDYYHKTNACAEALASFGALASEAAPLLLAKYQEFRRSVDSADRLLSAYAKVSGPEAIPELLHILQFEHTRIDVKRTAVRALENLGWQGEDYIFGQINEEEQDEED